jgi:hypothetical protein
MEVKLHVLYIPLFSVACFVLGTNIIFSSDRFILKYKYILEKNNFFCLFDRIKLITKESLYISNTPLAGF